MERSSIPAKTLAIRSTGGSLLRCSVPGFLLQTQSRFFKQARITMRQHLPYYSRQADQNRSRQALPCPLSSIPVPLANKTHRTEAEFLTFSHDVQPIPGRAYPPSYAFLFRSGTAALLPFDPLIQVTPFPQKEMRQSMQEPCPFLPEAGISTAGEIAPARVQPPFPLPRELPPAGKPPPPIPFAGRPPPRNQYHRVLLPIRV